MQRLNLAGRQPHFVLQTMGHEETQRRSITFFIAAYLRSILSLLLHISIVLKGVERLSELYIFSIIYLYYCKKY